MRTTCTGLAALALSAVALTAGYGCGGSKNLSRSELIAKADPICQRANERLHLGNVRLQEVPRVAAELATFEQQTSSELAKLAPPSSMANDWKVIVDGFQHASKGLSQLAEAARAKHVNPKTGELPGLSEVTSGQHDRVVIAHQDGFEACGKY